MNGQAGADRSPGATAAGAAEGAAAGAVAGAADGVAAGAGDGRWHLVSVEDVVHLLPSAYPEVVLRELAGRRRVLRVPVGLAEGTAIAYAWRRAATARPLTHQLFVDVLDRHNVRIAAVRITAVEEGVFYAELDTTGHRGRHVVPCRTSDALALALRQRPPVPILVEEAVLAEEASAAG